MLGQRKDSSGMNFSLPFKSDTPLDSCSSRVPIRGEPADAQPGRAVPGRMRAGEGGSGHDVAVEMDFHGNKLTWSFP